jgi:membrane associated rhomboid family serine protease
MYFLWVFGDNIEDRLNRIIYLAFYLFCGFAAFAIHGVLANDPGIPTLGASGAISGMMGAYLVLYPHRRLYQVFWFVQFKISVLWYLLIWLVLQVIFSMFSELGVSGGVAWFAHISGFVVGAIGIWALHKFGLVSTKKELR